MPTVLGRLVPTIFAIALLGATALLSPPSASAKPEFSARQNTPCWKCHVSPTGGGIRNPTGFSFSRQTALEAATRFLNENYKDFGEFVPAVGDYLQFGADMRAMWHDRAQDPDVDGDEQVNSSTFYLMEAAMYADAHLLPVLHLTGGYDAAQQTFEAYGQIDNLPAGLYARVGRFLLPYGIRLDDHTAFTRAPLGFHNTGQDAGIELGVRPGPAFVLAALTNGNPGDATADRDGDYYAVTAQTGVRFWKVALGGSFFHNTRAGLVRRTYGPWLTAGIWKFSYIGEAGIFDQERLAPADANDTEFIRGWAVTHLLDVEIIRGLALQGMYTHWDPNWDILDDHVYRIVGGVNFFPIPFFETQFQYRYNAENDSIDNDEILFMAHVGF